VKVNEGWQVCDHIHQVYFRVYKSYLDDEIDEGFWLRYMLGTWLRQVVDEFTHT
jgi:hypothetical protein